MDEPLKTLCWFKETRSKKIYIVYAFIYRKCSEKANLWGWKVDWLVGAWGCGWRVTEIDCKPTRGIFWEWRKCSELDKGDGCTTLQITQITGLCIQNLDFIVCVSISWGYPHKVPQRGALEHTSLWSQFRRRDVQTRGAGRSMFPL